MARHVAVFQCLRTALTAVQSGASTCAPAAAASIRTSRAFHSSPSESAAAAASVDSGTPLAGPDVVAFVQGSDRGIGLEFVEQLLARYSNTKVVASCRDPGGADHLDALHDQSQGRLDVVRLDVTSEGSIREAAEVVKDKYGHLNLLINCSGIFHKPNMLQPETSMRWLDPHAALLVYKINALGPMLVTKHMYPLLVQGAVTKQTGPPRISAVANLSSRTGSIAENKHGGWYSYRASKAALNQFTRTSAMEAAARKDPIVTVALHPGTVDTDLTRPYQKYLPADRIFTKEFAVAKLLDVIEGLKPSDNGRFIAWDGQDVPW